jgi:hypothetical protein
VASVVRSRARRAKTAFIAGGTRMLSCVVFSWNNASSSRRLRSVWSSTTSDTPVSRRSKTSCVSAQRVASESVAPFRSFGTARRPGSFFLLKERDQTRAAHRGRQAAHAALAKQERYPFDRSDGTEAVRLFQESRACFIQAGLSEDAGRVAEELQRWTSRIDEEYAALRLQLRVALDQRRHQDALSAVKGLQSLLGERGGAYGGVAFSASP